MRHEWTKEQREKLAEAITALCGFFGRELPDLSFRMYAKLLMAEPYEAVMAGMNQIMRDQRIRVMPTPAQILAIIRPPITAEEQARDVAALLFKACKRHSDSWPLGFYINGEPRWLHGAIVIETFDEALKLEVGELGAAVVRRYGGWSTFWNMWNHTSDGTFMAQVRDLAEALAKKSQSGSLDELPTLPPGPAQSEIGQTIAKLSEMKSLNKPK